MSNQQNETRRDFLISTASAAATASLATVIPSRVLGRGASTPPAERIALGVIGIGSRCTYVLNAMLQHEDIQCLAIADVQAKRRDDGKALVDRHYGNTDCMVYRDFRDILDRTDGSSLVAYSD